MELISVADKSVVDIDSVVIWLLTVKSSFIIVDPSIVKLLFNTVSPETVKLLFKVVSSSTSKVPLICTFPNKVMVEPSDPIVISVPVKLILSISILIFPVITKFPRMVKSPLIVPPLETIFGIIVPSSIPLITSHICFSLPLALK